MREQDRSPGDRDHGGGHDEDLVAHAVVLGDGARRRTAPNPWVGCVLVRDGVVVGEGATRPPGGDHAEVVALDAAGERARGATAYVTLEPCAHQGRTGPCADALVRAGVTRVVAALEDPDPQVAGQGFARVRAAGVEVVVGPGARAAGESLAAYLHHRRTGRPYCVAKSAVSLDGRLAAADGTSRWITGPAARADAHELRADSQAVVVGSGTALADRPALTVRDADAPPRPPWRVVLDARGRVPASGPLFDPALGPKLVVTTDAAPAAALDGWHAAGAKVEVVAAAERPHGARGVDLVATLALLGREGVLQALVEGGAALHGALLDAGLVDRTVTYVAPLLLGAAAPSAFGSTGPRTLADAARWHLAGTRVLGDDVRLDHVRAGAGDPAGEG